MRNKHDTFDNVGRMTRDKLARLLANENINIIRTNKEEAIFHPESRVLEIPMWSNISIDVEEMIIGNEVGHALYSSVIIEEAIKKDPKLEHFIRILEDIRTNKFIYTKYPGLREIFHDAYQTLHEQDFFGVKEMPIEEMYMIDKINMYYKDGFNYNDMDWREQVYSDRAGRTKTPEEVIELAKEMYDLPPLPEQQCSGEGEGDDEGDSKKDQNQNGEGQGQDQSGSSKDDMNGEGESDGQNNQQNQDGGNDNNDKNDDGSNQDKVGPQGPPTGDGRNDFKQGGTPPQIDDSQKNPNRGKNPHPQQDIKNNKKQPQRELSREQEQQREENKREEERQEQQGGSSVTYSSYKNNLESRIDRKHKINYVKINNKVTKNEPVVVSFKKILREFNPEKLTSKWNKEIERSASQFVRDHKDAVDYMVKEFEMKKSASLWKRSTVAKTGQINTRKICEYKTRDDIFKKINVVHKGKNHGMVVLVDWSGSMDGVIHDVIIQLLNLALFCRKIGIPYKVYAFSSGYGRNHIYEKSMMSDINEDLGTEDVAEYETIEVNAYGSVKLLELFTDRMKSNEFNRMVGIFASNAVFHCSDNFSLHGTPLNNALMWMIRNLDKFISKNMVEKMSFITITDGCSDTLSHSNIIKETNSDVAYIDTRNLFLDRVSKKTYRFPLNGGSQQSVVLLEILKDRYPYIQSIGFYLNDMEIANKRGMALILSHNVKKDFYKNNVLKGMTKDYKENRVSIMEDTGVRDRFFVIDPFILRVDSKDFNVEIKDHDELTEKFTEFMINKKRRRVVLREFMDNIS